MRLYQRCVHISTLYVIASGRSILPISSTLYVHTLWLYQKTWPVITIECGPNPNLPWTSGCSSDWSLHYVTETGPKNLECTLKAKT